MTARITRRQALQHVGLGTFATLAAPRLPLAAEKRKKLPVAAVVTEYRTFSHADVIVGKILEGWRQDGGPGPDLEVVSLYADQVSANDLSRPLAEKHGFRIAQTIDEAVTLGQDRLPVAGVLSIGEHGSYPYTPDTRQHIYPRRRFFDEIVAAMRRCGEFVPLFNDKHLAYRWQDARHMYDTARRHKIPFMAGSSLPTTWRYPAKQLPVGGEMEEAVAIGYGGNEAYGFHALEALQCIVERRRGGETGVAAVSAVSGDQIWEAEKQKKWTRSLLEPVLQTINLTADGLDERIEQGKTEEAESIVFYLIEYRDGMKATLAMLHGITDQFAVAARMRGQNDPYACWTRLEEGRPFGHFEHMLRGIEHMIHTSEPAWPVERTLLTTGILDRAMHSLNQGGKRLLTPELDIHYQPSPWGFANIKEENFPS
jgi:hypothetical protein